MKASSSPLYKKSQFGVCFFFITFLGPWALGVWRLHQPSLQKRQQEKKKDTAPQTDLFG
jgi:hypothetical protein